MYRKRHLCIFIYCPNNSWQLFIVSRHHFFSFRPENISSCSFLSNEPFLVNFTTCTTRNRWQPCYYSWCCRSLETICIESIWTFWPLPFPVAAYLLLAASLLTTPCHPSCCLWSLSPANSQIAYVLPWRLPQCKPYLEHPGKVCMVIHLLGMLSSPLWIWWTQSNTSSNSFDISR